jgi:dCTP deaminase
MAFWSGETLERLLPALIDPYDPNLIDCAAYTLRMGSEVYVSPSEAEQDAKKITIQKLDLGQSFTIPAGQFAFLLTEEKVIVPRGKLAFISMKSGIKLRGLVNVSGFHVDPGYDGKLIFAVFNAGPKTIHLRRGEKCFLIWFADLDNEKSERAKTDKGHTSISTDLVTKISGEVMSFEGLSAKINDLKEDLRKVESKQENIKFVGTLVIGILIAALVVPNAKGFIERLSPSAISSSSVPVESSKSPAAAPKQ